MKSFYLDYNATSPLSHSYKKALMDGLVPEGNSSSTHHFGKQVAGAMLRTEMELYSYFGLTSDTHQILFHSGATEAANTFLRQVNKSCVLYFGSDHPCISALCESTDIGSDYMELNLGARGEFNKTETVAQIKKLQPKYENIYLHFTHLHNETGLMWDLNLANEIKKETGCIIYVDAVQLPGKILQQEKLDPELDIYTFSGHKFGALKGVGFSFVKKSHVYKPLILGGGQQSNKRSGTVNTHGIISLYYALHDLKANFSKRIKILELKKDIKNLLLERENIEVIESDAINTICFIHGTMKADLMLIHFDMNGLSVSSGSACSSGSSLPSKTLEIMGFGELAKNSIRISLGADNLEFRTEIIERIKQTLTKL